MFTKVKNVWNARVEVPLHNAILILLVALVGVHIYEYRSWPMSTVAEAAVKSVVVIECTKGNSFATTAGFVASKYGHIITVAHGLSSCIGKNEKNITVRFWEDPLVPHKAKIIRFNRNKDAALLQVPAVPSDIVPLKINTGIQRQGTRIIAIGHPELFYWSVTFGVVSADRVYTRPTKHIIQVSSPINRGNSGGPILNDSGEVIGIASFNINSNATLGFLVPGDTIRHMLNEVAH